MLRIAHYSDLHAEEKTKDEALKILAFILDTFRERQVSAILNSGDTFGGSVALGDKGPINELLELLFPHVAPHYIIEGTKSHDLPGAIDIFEKLNKFSDQIYIYRTPFSCGLVKDQYDGVPQLHPDTNLDSGDGISCGHISFLPAPTKSFLAKDFNGSPEKINQEVQKKLRSILADFGARAASNPRPHILIGHITVAGSETSTGQVLLGGDIQVSAADIALANADYVALGHIHKAQKISPNIYYAGSPYHQNFGELEEKGFNIVTFDDAGKLVDVEFVKTPSIPRQVIDVAIDGDSITWSADVCPRANVRVRVYGPKHELLDSRIATINEMLANSGCPSFKVESIPTPESHVVSTEISNAKTLRAKVVEWGAVNNVNIPESALVIADELEAMPA